MTGPVFEENIMKAIILAAGRGSRMKAMTEERPKCLAELDGTALLDLQVNALKAAGIAEIGIVTGYRRELLINRGLVEFHNPRWSETNMVSSLASAEDWLENDTCIVSYSDIFYAPSAVQSLMTISSELALTYDPNWLVLWQRRFEDPLVDAETFKLDHNGNLREIGNKPDSVSEVQGQYMGLLRFTPIGWAEVKRIRAQLTSSERDAMHMTGTLQRVIDAGQFKVNAVPYEGLWGEVDTAEDLAVYQNG